MKEGYLVSSVSDLHRISPSHGVPIRCRYRCQPRDGHGTVVALAWSRCGLCTQAQPTTSRLLVLASRAWRGRSHGKSTSEDGRPTRADSPPKPFASVQLFSILRTRLQLSTLPVLHIDITFRRRQQRACHRRPGQRRRRKGWRSWAITSLPPHDHVSLPKALNTRCLRPHITDTLGSPIRPPAIAHATSSALGRPAGHAASQHRHFPPRLVHLPVTEPYTACEHGR